MNKNKIGILIIGILSILLISVTIYIIKGEESEPLEYADNCYPVIKFVGFADETELDNFNRDEAVKVLKELMHEVGNVPSNINTEEEDTIIFRLKMLNSEDTNIEDVLTKEVIDKLYFAEEFGNDNFNKQFAASALLIYHEIIRDNGVANDFNTVIDSFEEIVYLDNKFMTAHIPLDIFIGSSTGVAFEMQFIDGQWKLNPYTIMMSLNLIGVLNDSTQ